MFAITDRTTTNNVLATFDGLGIKPPKGVAAAFARAEKLTEKSGSLGARPGDLEAAVTAAILAGREPAADPEVQRVATASMLADRITLPEAVAGAALDGIRDACLAHLDEIVTAWRKPFDDAAHVLTEAHQRIGDLPLEDTATIVAQGGDIADVWAKAKGADQVITQVLNGWSNIMTLVRVPLNADHRPLKLAALTKEQWRNLPAKLSAWDAVRAGLTLSLPSLDEYRARVATIQKSIASEQAAAGEVIDPQRSAMQDWVSRTTAAVAR